MTSDLSKNRNRKGSVNTGIGLEQEHIHDREEEQEKVKRGLMEDLQSSNALGLAWLATLYSLFMIRYSTTKESLSLLILVPSRPSVLLGCKP